MAKLPPIPFRNNLIETVARIGPGGNVKVEAKVVTEWLRWLQALVRAVDATEQDIGSVALTAQGATIPTTALAVTVSAGLYRVSWAARVSRAATTSSSLTVTVGWVSGGVACSSSGAALTGNTTASVQSGSFLINVDEGTDIDYSAVYASVGGTSMQFELSVVVEAVG